MIADLLTRWHTLSGSQQLGVCLLIWFVCALIWWLSAEVQAWGLKRAIRRLLPTDSQAPVAPLRSPATASGFRSSVPNEGENRDAFDSMLARLDALSQQPLEDRPRRHGVVQLERRSIERLR